MISANRNFFNVIDTEVKAYYLGFLFADGNVYQTSAGNYSVGIHIHKKDVSILKRFRNALDSQHSISQKGDFVQFQIGGDILARDLIKHGCVPRKSLILEFPTTVPKHLLRHFIRGYSDGDGCIYWNRNKRYPTTIICQWSLLGTEDFIQSIISILNEELNISANIRKRGNIYEMRVWRPADFRKCLDWLYNDSITSLSLSRKRNKFESWKDARI